MYLYLVFFINQLTPTGIYLLAVCVFIYRNIPHYPVRENTFGWYIPPGLIDGIFHQVKALFLEYTKPVRLNEVDNYLGIFLPASFWHTYYIQSLPNIGISTLPTTTDQVGSLPSYRGHNPAPGAFPRPRPKHNYKQVIIADLSGTYHYIYVCLLGLFFI